MKNKTLAVTAAVLSIAGAGLTTTGAVMRHNEQHHAEEQTAPAPPPPESSTTVVAENHVYIYQAKVERVVDGDTVRVQIPSFPPPFNPIAVRIDHVNTPEKRAPAPACEIALGERASAFAHEAMPDGTNVTVLYDDRRQDKYGRLLARIVLPNGRDYGQSLIEAGLAKPYNGEKKTEWC